MDRIMKEVLIGMMANTYGLFDALILVDHKLKIAADFRYFSLSKRKWYNQNRIYRQLDSYIKDKVSLFVWEE